MLPMLPLPRKAAVVLAVVGHLPRSIQAYPQGCNTHNACSLGDLTSTEAQSTHETAVVGIEHGLAER